MRTVTLIAAALVITAVATAATNAPRLTLVQKQPPVVAGAGFVPNERVTVTAITLYGPRIVRVNATATGSFRARFALTDEPCGSPIAFRAKGASSESGGVAPARKHALRATADPLAAHRTRSGGVTPARSPCHGEACATWRAAPRPGRSRPGSCSSQRSACPCAGSAHRPPDSTRASSPCGRRTPVQPGATDA